MESLTTSFISFKINNVDFSLDTTCIKGIIEGSKSTPVPNSDSCVEGMLEYLDSILTQIDIHKYLFDVERDKSIKHPLLVCETDKASLAFKVDSINGIYEVYNSDLIELDAILRSSCYMVKNVFNREGVLNQILDIELMHRDIVGDVTEND